MTPAEQSLLHIQKKLKKATKKTEKVLLVGQMLDGEIDLHIEELIRVTEQNNRTDKMRR